LSVAERLSTCQQQPALDQDGGLDLREALRGDEFIRPKNV